MCTCGRYFFRCLKSNCLKTWHFNLELFTFSYWRIRIHWRDHLHCNGSEDKATLCLQLKTQLCSILRELWERHHFSVSTILRKRRFLFVTQSTFSAMSRTALHRVTWINFDFSVFQLVACPSKTLRISKTLGESAASLEPVGTSWVIRENLQISKAVKHTFFFIFPFRISHLET